MKKLIDSRGRLFGVLSIIDLIVLLVVICLGIGLYMRYFVIENTSASAVQTQKVTYVLEVNGVRLTSVDVLREGDNVYAREDDGYIGKISKVDYAPARVVSTKADGTYVVASNENRYDVRITIEADGRVTGGRYYANKTREINTNLTMDIYTKYVAFMSRVAEIER